MIPLEKKLYYLSASVLIYYGVQRLVKSEKYSCRSEDDHIAQEDIIPGIYPFLLRKYMDMKSVPPPLAPFIRHMLMAALPRIPPKMLIRSVS